MSGAGQSLMENLSRIVEHYRNARTNYKGVDDRILPFRKLLTTAVRNYEKAKAQNPNSPRIQIIESEMKQLLTNINRLKPELLRKFKIVKQAYDDVKSLQKIISEEHSGQVGAFDPGMDVSSFQKPGKEV